MKVNQSDTKSQDTESYPAERAIDGDPTTFSWAQSKENIVWWNMDMAAPIDIHHVVVHLNDNNAGMQTFSVRFNSSLRDHCNQTLALDVFPYIELTIL